MRVPTSMTIVLDTADFGTEITAGIVVRDQSGMPIDVGSVVSATTLESSDTTVATVGGASLLITPTGIGETVITAHYGALQASGTLAVRLGPAPAQKLVAGDFHNCLINSSGATVCWGSDERGALGDGNMGVDSEFDSGSPVTVIGNHSFTTLAAGHSTCALEDGTAWCWGDGGEGALGNGSDDDSAEPVETAGELTFAQMSAGSGHVCALTSDGTAYCWGFNEDGEVGNGTTGAPVDEPVAVDTDVKFARIVASGDHTCALTRLGKTYCWGFGAHGVLGTGNEESQPTPVAVLDTLTFVSLAGGYNHECGLDRAGRAICWGMNDGGEAGNGSTDSPVLAATLVDATVRFSMIGAGTENHLCGIERESDQLYCWGVGGSGQIGDGGTDNALSPTAIPDFLAKTVATGVEHSCAIGTNDDVFCWGSNARGQIGNGLVDGDAGDPVLSPSLVNDLGGVSGNRTARSVVTKSVQPEHALRHRSARRHDRRSAR